MMDSNFKQDEDDLLAEILGVNGRNDEKSWLDPLAETFRETKIDSFTGDLHPQIPSILSDVDDTAREETSAMAIQQNGVTQNVHNFQSFDSHSSSFLDNGSFAGGDTKPLLRNSSGVLPPAMPGSGRLSRPNSLPSFDPLCGGSGSTHIVRAKGGHWAWIPDPGSDSLPPGPPPSQPRGQSRGSVPVKTGRLPLALNMKQHDVSIEDRDIIDSFDILEMADTLIFENGTKQGTRHGSGRRLTTSSCPVASLFQDEPSELSGGLNHPRHHSKELYRGTSGEILSSSRVRSRPSSAAIPMTFSHSTSSKVNRCSRSQSSPHTSNILAASCPSRRGGSYGGSYGRSHSLLDSKDSISEEKVSDAFDPDYEFSTLTPSYSSRSLDTLGNPKKKHNPWTVTETVSLINGVEELGVGKWADIKRAPEFENVFDLRSAVDLKDKWRNLTRLAKLPVAKLEEKVAKDMSRSGDSIPLESYLQVRRIAGIS